MKAILNSFLFFEKKMATAKLPSKIWYFLKEVSKRSTFSVAQKFKKYQLLLEILHICNEISIKLAALITKW